MATFQERDSGWWQARIRRKGYPVQSRSFERKTDAEVWAREVEGEMDRGVFVSRTEAEATTLYEALKRYKREVTPAKKSSVQEEYRIDTWQRHKLASRSLASLRGADFAAHRDERLKAGVAPATVRLELSVISHLFSTATKEWGLPLQNPIAMIRKPRADNARERRLSAQEEHYLLTAVDDPGHSTKVRRGDRRNVWMPALVRVAIETAMRQGELLALDWKHVDLARKVAHLPETKNGTARDVPLSSAAVAVLECLPRAIAGHVFATTASAVKQSWMRAVARGRRNYLANCKQAKTKPIPGFLDDLTFHDLRHEATTRLAEKLAMHELMKVTGHRDTRMLARYYHPRAEDLARKLG